MAIQWCDDFGSYGTNKAYMLNGLYAENAVGALVADPDITATGTVFRASGSGSGSDTSLRKVLTTARSEVGVALRLWMGSLPTSFDMSAIPIAFANAGNQQLVCLYVTTTGALYVLVNAVGWDGVTPPLAQTAGPVLVVNAWQHIEMKVNFHATTGSVEVRVDNVVVIDQDNLNTLGSFSGPCAQVKQIKDNTATSTGITWYIKDYVIWDTTGSENNDFLSTVRCIRLPVDGDVSLNWTPSSGSTGWNLLDESPPADAGYISAATPPPAAAVFDFADLPPDITSVRALMTLIRANNSDGGDGMLQTSLLSSGVPDDGADRQITVAPTYWFDISEIDPNAAAPWTPLTTDAAQLKLNRTL